MKAKLITVFVIAAIAAVLAQGPRTPLNVASTDANYHAVINVPGSYYLAGNLDVTKPNGLRIQSDGVTLDLEGFTIHRTGGSNGGDAVTVTSAANRCTVLNGTIGYDLLEP